MFQFTIHIAWNPKTTWLAINDKSFPLMIKDVLLHITFNLKKKNAFSEEEFPLMSFKIMRIYILK